MLVLARGVAYVPVCVRQYGLACAHVVQQHTWYNTVCVGAYSRAAMRLCQADSNLRALAARRQTLAALTAQLDDQVATKHCPVLL